MVKPKYCIEMPSRIKDFSQTLAKPIVNLLVNQCVVCQKQTTREQSMVLICESCLSQLEKPKLSCQVCAEPLSAAVQNQRCKDCINKPLAFDCVSYVAAYDGWLAAMIIAAKVSKQVNAIAALRYLLRVKHDEFIIPSDNTVLLPMPSPKSRLMSRGFNLPALMAKQLAQQHQLSILPPTAVTLPFYVPKQAKLSRQQRQKNRHNYQINTQLPSNIIIIDDIITTGSTVGELARKLKSESVKSVAVWSIAKVFDT